MKQSLASSRASLHAHPQKLPRKFDISPTAVAAPGGFLGIHGKSNSAPGVDLQTGEVLPLKKAFDLGASRLERFALQSVVRKLLPHSATAKCLRCRQKGKDVDVWKSREFNSASFGGLQTCGSVWACPVCSSKISERRRIELQSAIEKHTAKKDGKPQGQVLLLTLTNPHYLGDFLGDILDKQATALKYFTGCRAARKTFAAMGQIGTVRAFEVTHGRRREVNHGWHPHYHVLMFVAPDLDLKFWAEELYCLWAAACIRAGLEEPSREHGLKLDDGTKAARYASKWGMDSELTKGHSKKAQDGGETPFDLLRAYLAGDDPQAAALFVEFTKCFHGKRQLFWSKGLKAKFAITDETDSEVAGRTDDAAVLLGSLTIEQWRDVLAADGRALVLQLAETGGWPAIKLYLERIKRPPQSMPRFFNKEMAASG